MWVWGFTDLDAFMAFVSQVTLNGHMANMTVPFLITHGANDRQIPREYALQSRDQAVNSPRVDFRLVTEREGGVEHVSADNLEPTRSYIADWLADRFQEMD